MFEITLEFITVAIKKVIIAILLLCFLFVELAIGFRRFWTSKINNASVLGHFMKITHRFSKLVLYRIKIYFIYTLK